MTIEIHPATADRFDNVAAILGKDDPNAPACWCLGCWATSGDAHRLLGRARRDYLRALCERDRAPGVIAYVDGVPAGWCAVGERADMGRMARSRTIQRIDDQPVWSIGCFVVRVGYRRRGLAHRLVEGAVAYARNQGAEMIEGYPIDTDGKRVSTAFAYVGTTGLFEQAGFTRVAETAAKSAGLSRWIYRLPLTPDT